MKGLHGLPSALQQFIWPRPEVIEVEQFHKEAGYRNGYAGVYDGSLEMLSTCRVGESYLEAKHNEAHDHRNEEVAVH